MQGAHVARRAVTPGHSAPAGSRRLPSWPVVVAVMLAAGACGGASARSSARIAVTSTTTTTTTSPAGLPCGGPTAVAAAVRASPVAGLDQNPTVYQVENVSTAASDPTWGRFDTLPQPGQESTYQGGSGLVHCVAGAWAVTDFGTAEVGCPGGLAAPPPAVVAADLGIDCQ